MIKIYIDGSCDPNPGEGRIGIVGYQEGKKEELFTLSYFIGQATNNIAEYQALITGLKYAIKQQYEDVLFKTDSNIVACQFSRKWKKSKTPHLQKLLEEALLLKKQLKNVRIEWIPREQNVRADELSTMSFENY